MAGIPETPKPSGLIIEGDSQTSKPESLRARARRAVTTLDELTAESLKGSREAAGRFLIGTVTSPGPDESPEIRVDADLLSVLPPRQALAVEHTTLALEGFNRNFGPGSSLGEVLTWENPYLQQFTTGVAKVYQGLVHPDSEFGNPEKIIDSMAQTTTAHVDLVQWAEGTFLNSR